MIAKGAAAAAPVAACMVDASDLLAVLRGGPAPFWSRPLCPTMDAMYADLAAAGGDAAVGCGGGAGAGRSEPVQAVEQVRARSARDESSRVRDVIC